MDKFLIKKTYDLGRLLGIKIRHDNEGVLPDWFLDRVEITDTLTNDKYYFHCRKWFSLTKDDRRIERIIKEEVFFLN